MADIAKAICALAAKIKGAAVEETDNIAEAVDLCTENYSGGGGGSDMFVVTLTGVYDESTGTSTYSADKTFAEIDAAFRAGKAVCLRDVDPEDETYVQWFPPATATSDGVTVSAYVWGQVKFNIPTVSSQNGSLYFTEYTLSSQGEWTNNYGEYTVSPRG